MNINLQFKFINLLKLTCITVILIVSGLNNTFNIKAGYTNQNYSTYLPFVSQSITNDFSSNSKFIGIYMQQYWTDGTVSEFMLLADNLASKKHTVTGWFINLQNIAFTSRQNDINYNNFNRQLEALWNKGYISFINLTSAQEATSYDVSDNCLISFSAYQVAHGDCDRAIQKMADLYYQWISLGGERQAFIAPFTEMNGVYSDGIPWTSYGGDPENYKLAYQRILNIFEQRGVSRDRVWWVFAPNGWSWYGHEFEKYFPGDDIVDVIGFSSYNFGFCQQAFPWQSWENYTTLFDPYLARIRAIAPGKPVILAQTGTTAQHQSAADFNVYEKNQWLRSNYEYLSQQPQVLGILYYDYDLSP
jgi:beta-mannanase